MWPFDTASGSPESSTQSVDLALGEGEREAMFDFLQRLVRTPSPSGQEGEMVRLVLAELESLGVSDVHTDSLGNVIARLGSGDGPTLLYDAHMDTVKAAQTGWPHDPLAATIQDGVLYGLGACDMKSGLAAMVYAAGRLAAQRIALAGQLVLACVVQEEPCEGYSISHLLVESGIQPNWVVLGEPSDLKVMLGQRGRVMLRVTVPGRTCHGSRPDLGENAIYAASRLIFGIELLADQMADDPLLGPASVAVTRIESDAPSLNAIPDRCVLYVDRRLTLGETPKRALTEIEAIIAREGIGAEVEITEYVATSYTGLECRRREAFNAWALDEDHLLVTAIYKAAEGALGFAPEVGRWAFSTDGVYTMGEMQIPTVGFGPGNPDHAHTVHDQVRLDDVAKAAHVYAGLAVALLR
jgi:putative selenium metabolism hydrolase